MLNNEKIKLKAWERVQNFINLNDIDFNNQAYSFKITSELNLAIWCDIDYEFDKSNSRYFIVSIRYNPYDELFGEDISNLEYSTQNTSQYELNMAINMLLDSIKGKEVTKNNWNGDYCLTIK